MRPGNQKLTITRQDIEQDIEGFETRIAGIQKRLFRLPATTATAKERKKIKNKRRIFLTEIDHVQGLISIAEEALDQS